MILGCRAHHIGSPGFRLCSLMNRQSTNATKFTAAQSYMAEGCELNVKGRYMYHHGTRQGGAQNRSPMWVLSAVWGKGDPRVKLLCGSYAARARGLMLL